MPHKPYKEVQSILDQAQALVLAEKAEDAHKLLLAGLAEHDHLRLHRFLKRTYLLLGDEDAAAATTRAIINRIANPTPNEFALAGAAQANFIPLAGHKILYLEIPKCGSTTVKDMLHFILTGRFSDGEVHKKMANLVPEKRLRRPFLDRNYPDWERLLLVRDPIKRMRSYYGFNICMAADLIKEIPGRDRFYGLSLRPTYADFLTNLERYRQVFVGTRGHTNSLVSLAGNSPDRYTWVGTPSDMSDLRRHLSALTGVAIPKTHHFKSGDSADYTVPADLEDRIRERYGADYRVFGAYF